MSIVGPMVLVVVDFTVSYYEPSLFKGCRILADIARKMPEVILLELDVDELKSVAEEWAVEAMPTFVFVKGGKMVDKVVGTKEDELQMKIAKHSTHVAVADTVYVYGGCKPWCLFLVVFRNCSLVLIGLLPFNKV